MNRVAAVVATVIAQTGGTGLDDPARSGQRQGALVDRQRLSVHTALALADATPLQGGVPITIGGRVVGAVGVSGDSPQADEEIALAGARAIEGAAPGKESN